MAKIKCPHCGATNQDVSTDDPCWQCGTILGAPLSALNTESGPPTSAANAGQAPTAPTAQTTRSESTPPPTQVQKTRPEPTPPPTQQPIPVTRPNRQMGVVLTIALLVILLLIVFYVMKHH